MVLDIKGSVCQTVVLFRHERKKNKQTNKQIYNISMDEETCVYSLKSLR